MALAGNNNIILTLLWDEAYFYSPATCFLDFVKASHISYLIETCLKINNYGTYLGVDSIKMRHEH